MMTEAKEDATLSCSVDELMNGDGIKVILGHPESFATANGKQLLRELKRKERITLLCVD